MKLVPCFFSDRHGIKEGMPAQPFARAVGTRLGPCTAGVRLAASACVDGSRGAPVRVEQGCNLSIVTIIEQMF